MRRRRTERARRKRLAPYHRLMKGSYAATRMLRFASDLIKRDQPVEPVELGILHGLCHQRPGGLLKFDCERLGISFERGR